MTRTNFPCSGDTGFTTVFAQCFAMFGMVYLLKMHTIAIPIAGDHLL